MAKLKSNQMTMAKFNYFKKIVTDFKLNQMNPRKVQLNQKDHGKHQSKSNDPWQSSISSKTLQQA